MGVSATGPDLDDLTARLRRFVPAEKEALRRWEEGCRLKARKDDGDEALEFPDPYDEGAGGD